MCISSFNPIIMVACSIIVIVSIYSWIVLTISICIIKYVAINITYAVITSSNILIGSENFALHHRFHIVLHLSITPFYISTFTNKIILSLFIQ